jgi:hypothetical protein
MYQITLVVALLSWCLAPHLTAGDITIKNENCVWQGLSQTNQANFHVFQTKPEPSRDFRGSFAQLSDRCTEVWRTIRAGSAVTVPVEQFFDNESDLQTGVKVGPAMDCFYSVQAEGVIGGDQHVRGTKGQKITCRLDWAGVCQCRTE